MERQSMVHKVVVGHSGQDYQADYFVEAGIIHASIAGHVMLIPQTDTAPADTVRSILMGQLSRRLRTHSAVAGWTSQSHQGRPGG